MGASKTSYLLTGALFLVIVGSLAALSAASSIHHCLSCLSVAVLSSTLRKQPATAACLASPHSVTGFLVLNPTLHGLLWDKRKNFSWDSGGGGGGLEDCNPCNVGLSQHLC